MTCPFQDDPKVCQCCPDAYRKAPIPGVPPLPCPAPATGKGKGDYRGKGMGGGLIIPEIKSRRPDSEDVAIRRLSKSLRPSDFAIARKRIRWGILAATGILIQIAADLKSQIQFERKAVRGRRVDPGPVFCPECGRIVRRRDMVHTYGPDGQMDVDPVEKCPTCGVQDQDFDSFGDGLRAWIKRGEIRGRRKGGKL